MKLTNWQASPELAKQLSTHILPNYLPRCRWFRSKTRRIEAIDVQFYPQFSDSDVRLLCIMVSYNQGEAEHYLLPVGIITHEKKDAFQAQSRTAIISEVEVAGDKKYIVDALYSAAFRNTLFQVIVEGKQVENGTQQLVAEAGKLLKSADWSTVDSNVLNAEQSNTAIVYNDEYFLKIFRKLEYGINPDLELVRFLSEQTAFEHSPRYGGSLLLHEKDKKPIILGLMQNKIVNRGDAWSTTLEQLEGYYTRVLYADATVLPERVHKDQLYFEDIPTDVANLISRATYDRIVQLGQRTADMHIALASDRTQSSFAPTKMDEAVQQHLGKAQHQLATHQLTALEEQLPHLAEEQQAEANTLLAKKEELLSTFQAFQTANIDAEQTRVHGDYHLGQVLDDGEDYYIIDFEGEPMRSIEERRELNSPFKDVAGMVRSLHYAAYGELYLHPDKYPQIETLNLEAWAAQWFHYMSQAYLTAYFDRTEGQAFIPKSKEALEQLLRVFILEKAIYEVGYEMNSRPDWLKIPLRGVLYELAG